MNQTPDFQALFGSAPTPMLLVTVDSYAIVAVNDAYLRATLAEREQVLRLGLPDQDREGDPQSLRGSLDRVVAQGRPHTMPTTRHPFLPPMPGDDAQRWWRPRNAPMFDGAGRVWAILHEVEDVTELVDASQAVERSMQETAERLRLALEVGELATWDWDIASGRVVWSEQHFRMQGYAVGEVAPSYEAWIARVHPDDRVVAEAALVAARDGRGPYDHEFRVLRPDGEVRWMSAQGNFFRDGDGRAQRMVGVMRDVTVHREQRGLLEQQVRDRTHALRQLLQRVESLQDDERRRIARGLHDGLGQYLSSLSLAIGLLRKSPAEPEADGQLARLQALTVRLEEELDRQVFILRPTGLDDGGLGEGVAAYLEAWSEMTGVASDLQLHGFDALRLPSHLESAVFRVVQEALSNTARYAGATRVGVTLQRQAQNLLGTVEDDGVGFDPGQASVQAAGPPRYGLLVMRERIEALGGCFEIDARPGSGTTVFWRVPCDAAAQ